MRALLDHVIETDYGQFDLVWREDAGFDGDFDRVFAGQVNGLARAAQPGGLYLKLGRRSGGSQIRIELGDGEPAVTEEWEDIVEVSVDVRELGAGWMTWAGEDGGPHEIARGSYRVRVSARGRDEGDAHELSEEVLDF